MKKLACNLLLDIIQGFYGDKIMTFDTRINQLVASLNALKAESKGSNFDTESKFEIILENALQNTNQSSDKQVPLVEKPTQKENELNSQIPDWVDTNYGFSPSNPRKPNMREMMESISGQSLESLYANKDTNWKDISKLASDLLYGVVGSNTDTRDWSKIMKSDNIVEAARVETGKMYEPKVKLVSQTDNSGQVIKQIVMLEDKNGNALRSLMGSVKYLNETLQNFGATSGSIPKDLRSNTLLTDFDDDILEALESYQS